MTAQGQTADVSKRDRIKPCLLLILISLVLAGGFFHFFLFWTQEKTALAKNTVAITVSSEINATVSGSQKFKSKKFRRRKSGFKQRLPTCFIIGVRKGGTRALLRFLDLHPDIRTYNGRELHFFDSDNRYSRGLSWYKKKMPFTWPGQITVEKTPAYFHTFSVPKRIMLLTTNPKFLLVVRDPVVRLISDYVQLREKKEFRGNSYPSFSDSAFFPNGSVNQKYPPIRTGFYRRYLINWLRYFDRDQILVVSGENLVKNPLTELRRVESFLEIGHKITQNQVVFNEEKGFFCPVENEKVKCLGKSKGRRHPNVSKSEIEKLGQFYAAENRKFCRMANVDYYWCSYD